jgi:hypothetical protein
MDIHTTEACGQSKHAENDTPTGDTITSSTDERSCFHCGLSGHSKSECIHSNNAQDQHNTVNNGTASASRATQGNRHLIGLAENAAALCTAFAQAEWVIDSGVSHHLGNDRKRLN